MFLWSSLGLDQCKVDAMAWVLCVCAPPTYMTALIPIATLPVGIIPFYRWEYRGPEPENNPRGLTANNCHFQDASPGVLSSPVQWARWLLVMGLSEGLMQPCLLNPPHSGGAHCPASHG